MGQPYDSAAIYDWNGTYDGGIDLTTVAPSKLTNVRALWSQAAGSESELRLPWFQYSKFDRDYRALWNRAIDRQVDYRVRWSVSLEFQNIYRLVFGAAAANERAFRIPWTVSDAHEAVTRLSYGDTREHLQNAIVLPWGAVIEQQSESRLRWGEASPRQAAYVLPTDGSKPHAVVYRIVWGPGHAKNGGYGITWTNEPPLPPGTPIAPHLVDGIYMTPVLSIIRVSDSADLNAINASMTWDVGSYAWSFQANCPRSALPLIDPNVNSNPVLVQVTINGYVGYFVVEGYTDTRKFGGTGIQIRGRTRHALLGPPYAPKSTFTETTNKDASQLVNDALFGTGFTATWSATDWLVPANTFTYADLTPIEAIANVVGSIGGIIMPDLQTESFTVLPLYPTSPWNWPTTSPFAILPASFWQQIDGQWEGQGQPDYNGIYVSGQNGGKVGLVKLTGTSGDKQLPMVTDALLTDVAANTARGAVEIGKALKRKTETVKAILLPSPPSSTNPGIILPTSLLQITDIDGTTSWLGQVMSVQVDASRNGDALSVRQTLSVERHA